MPALRNSALCAALVASSVTSTVALASSHREAPFIAGAPKVDGTDFYMFRSYASGRTGFVTLIANYQPLQDAYGGPNYFTMDPDALYEIHVDNTGDSREDLTFQFRFSNAYGRANAGTTVIDGTVNGATTGPAQRVQVPLANLLAGDGASPGLLNVVETYTVSLVRGNRRSGNSSALSTAGGATSFTKPVDNIGNKSIPDYAGYANQYIYTVSIPGCTATGANDARVFVGQRREGFVVNLGQVFDQINLNPLGPRDGAQNTIGDKNVTSLALEIPIGCLRQDSDPVIGAWTTASKRQARLLNPAPAGPVRTSTGRGPSAEGGAWTQVSRLGSPLVNEVVIGITDKDKFNASEPRSDVTNFGSYVLYPSLPVLVNVLFPGATSVPATPRNDLLAAFVTGITTAPTDTPASFKFTAPTNLTVPGEMLRMNTDISPVVPGASGYSDLGFLGCDLAGFPNGRRVTDDVVDIALTVAEGALTGANPLQTCSLAGAAPKVVNAGAVVNDGAMPDPENYLTVFPYLETPLPGSP